MSGAELQGWQHGSADWPLVHVGIIVLGLPTLPNWPLNSASPLVTASGSEDGPLAQCFSTFLMLGAFNTVPYITVIPQP